MIYADPPWRYKVWRGSGAAEKHYPTMSIEDIKALPVSELAADDCALFLWITFPMGYITNAEPGHGLLRIGGALVPFSNTIPRDSELYRLMSTTPGEG